MNPDALFALTEPAEAGGSGTAVTAGFGGVAADAPLAVRMRPLSIDDLVGQQHLLAPGAPLRRLVTGGQLT